MLFLANKSVNKCLIASNLQDVVQGRKREQNLDFLSKFVYNLVKSGGKWCKVVNSRQNSSNLHPKRQEVTRIAYR